MRLGRQMDDVDDRIKCADDKLQKFSKFDSTVSGVARQLDSQAKICSDREDRIQRQIFDLVAKLTELSRRQGNNGRVNEEIERVKTDLARLKASSPPRGSPNDFLGADDTMTPIPAEERHHRIEAGLIRTMERNEKTATVTTVPEGRKNATTETPTRRGIPALALRNRFEFRIPRVSVNKSFGTAAPA